MKALSGWTISVGLVLAATAANAQGAPQSRPGYIATSDFTEPYADVPPPPRVIYGSPAPEYGYGYRQPPRDYGAPRDYGPPDYGPATGYDVGLLPPREVFAILRETGFQPLGVPHLRGLFYHAAAVDRRGDEVRVVIDARNGRIVRFVPAYGQGEEGRAVPPRNAPYGYGPPPADQLSSGQPRPQANAPKMASRTPQAVPVPRSAPARSNEEKPVAAEKPATPPPQQSAAVQVKPTEAATATAPAPEPKPAPVIQPTQEMPKVQGLE